MEKWELCVFWALISINTKEMNNMRMCPAEIVRIKLLAEEKASEGSSMGTYTMEIAATCAKANKIHTK